MICYNGAWVLFAAQHGCDVHRVSDEALGPDRVGRFQAEKNNSQFGGCGRGLFRLVKVQSGEGADGISSNENTHIRVVLSKHNIAFSQALVEQHRSLIALAQPK